MGHHDGRLREKVLKVYYTTLLRSGAGGGGGVVEVEVEMEVEVIVVVTGDSGGGDGIDVRCDADIANGT